VERFIRSMGVCENSNASLAGDEWASFSQSAMFRSDFSKVLAALRSNCHLVVLDIGYEFLGGIGVVDQERLFRSVGQLEPLQLLSVSGMDRLPEALHIASLCIAFPRPQMISLA